METITDVEMFLYLAQMSRLHLVWQTMSVSGLMVMGTQRRRVPAWMVVGGHQRLRGQFCTQRRYPLGVADDVGLVVMSVGMQRRRMLMWMEAER